jgi:hypothetical protein
MSQTLPSQHPAVVLRTHYRNLRALLVVALIAVIGLSVAVVILATEDSAGTRSVTPVSAPAEQNVGPRFIHPHGQRYELGR